MDVEKYKTHLNTLKEMILDEERLVTYVSISKEFCIHVNESKSLMNEALEEIRKKHADISLNVNYIISGLGEDHKARTLVCSENDVNEHRKGFKLLFFDHIYSINKGKPTVDKVALMAVTTFEDYQLCSGLVKSNDCIKRTSDEIGRLKLSSQEQVTDQKVQKPLPKKVKEENPSKPISNGHSEGTKIPEMKSEPTVKQEKMSPQKDNNVNGHKQNPDVKNTGKPQKGIAGFFSRTDSTTAKKNTKESVTNIKHEKRVKTEIEESQVKVDQMDVDEDIDIKNSLDTKSSKMNAKAVVNNDTKKKENKAKSKDNNKSLTQIKKTAKVDKKRKRVLHVSDSESEEEKNDPFADEENVLNKQMDVESEDEIPPTPSVNTIKVASNMLNPRKRRKIVNKTYTSEDGYILTKKEEVYESMSENEDLSEVKENIEKQKKINDEPPKEKSGPVKTEVSPHKKNGPKNNRKKISPPQKGKQATLMSFFKKA